MDRNHAFDRSSDGNIDSFASTSPGFSAASDLQLAQYLAEASQGDANACFDLGVAFSTGSHGVASDLVEAHKWFNLAAVAGHECAKSCRADIAGEMTPREIAEAQRRAREWIAATGPRSA